MKIQRLIRGLLLGTMFFQVGCLFAKKSKTSRQAYVQRVRSGEQAEKISSAQRDANMQELKAHIKERLAELGKAMIFFASTGHSICSGDWHTVAQSVASQCALLATQSEFAPSLKSVTQRLNLLTNSQVASLLISPVAHLYDSFPRLEIANDLGALQVLATLATILGVPVPAALGQ